MKGKFREWDLPELIQEEHPDEVQVPERDAMHINYDPEDDEELYYEDGGGLGPSDFVFIPRHPDQLEEPLGEQGPGPETAARHIE